jgi:hypothetical protein
LPKLNPGLKLANTFGVILRELGDYYVHGTSTLYRKSPLANTKFKVFPRTPPRDNFTGLVNTKMPNSLFADDSGRRVWRIHVLTTGKLPVRNSQQCA